MSTTPELTVYVSLQSPWTYLAWKRLVVLAQRYNAELHCRPINMARLFEATGGLPLPKRSPHRQAYRKQELRRFSKALDEPLHEDPAFFPVNDRLAARAAIALRLTGLDDAAFIGRCLAGVWQHQENIADKAVLVSYLIDMGADHEALIGRAMEDDIEHLLEMDTKRAIDEGVFGVPFMIVGEERFWGQDRLEFVEQALKQMKGE